MTLPRGEDCNCTAALVPLTLTQAAARAAPAPCRTRPGPRPPTALCWRGWWWPTTGPPARGAWCVCGGGRGEVCVFKAISPSRSDTTRTLRHCHRVAQQSNARLAPASSGPSPSPAPPPGRSHHTHTHRGQHRHADGGGAECQQQRDGSEGPAQQALRHHRNRQAAQRKAGHDDLQASPSIWMRGGDEPPTQRAEAPGGAVNRGSPTTHPPRFQSCQSRAWPRPGGR